MRIRLFIFITLVTLPLFGKEWALKDASKGWNSQEVVTLYFHNSQMQTQWAWEALSRYTFSGNERVLDFGSGTGNLSAMISFMVPKGFVWGVDISSPMVDFASKMFPSSYYKNLSFIHIDNVNFNNQINEKFDLITSFCVFHLIPNPTVVLKRLKEKMHKHSKLVICYPIGGNEPFFKAVGEEMEKRGWSFPPSTSGTIALRNPDKIKEIFHESGLTIEHQLVVETKNPFSTKKELIDWFEGTLSANWNIPVDQRREFFSDLADRYLIYRPEDRGEGDFVYFTLKRVDIIASLKP